MARRYSWPAGWIWMREPRSGRVGPGLRFGWLHPRTTLQLVLAVHHNAFARSEPIVNQCLASLDLRDLQRAQADRLILLNDESERPFRPALNNRRRHHHAVGARHEKQSRVDELAGPESEIVIGEGGFEFDGAGSGINLVVDDGEFACGKDIGIVARDG